MTRHVDGHALAEEILTELAGQVRRMPRSPCLAVVLVSDDPHQHRHAALKHRAAARAGIRTVACTLPPLTTAPEVQRALDDLVADPDVDGVFLQLPLPDHLDPRALHDRLPAIADVDGLGRSNRMADGASTHRPAAVEAVLHVLTRHDITLPGRTAIVVGTSWDLGMPLLAALTRSGAAVRSVAAAADLPRLCQDADVLVSTAGIPMLIDARSVGPGAIVIDAGGTITAHGPVGDVDVAALEGLASLVVPHPGGIGPLTVACLLRSTVVAAD